MLALTRPNGNTTHAGFIRDENGREFGVGEYQTARSGRLARCLALLHTQVLNTHY